MRRRYADSLPKGVKSENKSAGHATHATHKVGRKYPSPIRAFPEKARSFEGKRNDTPSQTQSKTPKLYANKDGGGGDGLCGITASSASSASSAVYIHGWHAVVAALSNPIRKNKTLYASRQSLAKLELEGVTIPFGLLVKPMEAFPGKISENVVHQGLVLETENLPVFHLKDKKPQGGIVVFDGITDVQNIGSMLRAAVVFGVRNALFTKDHTPILNPKAMGTLAKVASGALEHVHLYVETNLARSLEELKKMGYFVMGLDEGGEKELQAFSFPRQTALVMGAEGKGLRPLTKQHCDILLFIQGSASLTTLNVNQATTLALYAYAQHS